MVINKYLHFTYVIFSFFFNHQSWWKSGWCDLSNGGGGGGGSALMLLFIQVC